MAVERFENQLRQTTLVAAIASGATSLIVASAVGLPTSPQFRIRVDDEIMLVTGVSGPTLTVTRAQEGTAAAAHIAGAVVAHVVTAEVLRTAGRFPLTPAGAVQTVVAITAGNGVPSNSDGQNGWWYLRGDGGAGSSLYLKVSGSWVARA